MAPAMRGLFSEARPLCGYVGRQLALEQGDLIFEIKLAFLETLQLELILGGALRESGDYIVEVAVLNVQLIDTFFERFDIQGHHGWGPPFGSRTRIQYSPNNCKKRDRPIGPRRGCTGYRHPE